MLGIDIAITQKKGQLKGAISKALGKTQFMKAIHSGGSVEVMTRQSSAMLGDLVNANCLLIFPEEKVVLDNEMVEIISLPQPFLF